MTNLEPGDVLFIDEIHRLSPFVEEVLYPAMEDYQLDIMIGEGPAARSIKLDSCHLYPGRCDYQSRAADLAAARSLRDCPAPGVLRGRRSGPYCGALGQHSGDWYRYTGGHRNCSSLQRHSQNRQSAVAQGQGLRRGEGGWLYYAPVADRALDMLSVDQHGFDHQDRRLLLTMIEKV